MHNFEEPYRTNKRKIRVHGKWELVLVLLVVIAGIIVTTIAITKAKEKREIMSQPADNIAVIQVTDPNDESKFLEQGDSDTDINGRNIFKRNKYRSDLDQSEDYEHSETQVVNMEVNVNEEQQQQQKPLEHDRIMLDTNDYSSKESSTPMSMVQYDGLPGYPPPPHFDPNVYLLRDNDKEQRSIELSSDSAGYIISPVSLNLPNKPPPNKMMSRVDGDESRNIQTRQMPLPYNWKTVNSKSNYRGKLPKAIIEERSMFNMPHITEDYITPEELLYLQQSRPDLFHGGATVFHKRALRNKRDVKYRKLRKSLLDSDNKENKDNVSKEQADTVKEKKRKRSSRKSRNMNKYVESNDDNKAQLKKSFKKKKFYKKRLEKNKNRYSKEESKKVEKYDLLGSGNFEIIRGGILDYQNDKDSSQSKKKVANDSVENKNKINENDKVQNGKDYDDTTKDNEDDTENFEPFNLDLFGNDPILGFQGYDNFDSTKNSIVKLKP